MTLPHAVFIMSDDVRVELGNKTTVVGIYSAEMNFHTPEMPTVMPRLGVTFFLRWPSIDTMRPVRVQIYGPADSSKALAEFDLDPSETPRRPRTPGDPPPGLMGSFGLELVPMKEGAFEVYMSEGDTRALVHRLPVNHRPLQLAPASPPPPTPPVRTRRRKRAPHTDTPPGHRSPEG